MDEELRYSSVSSELLIHSTCEVPGSSPGTKTGLQVLPIRAEQANETI